MKQLMILLLAVALAATAQAQSQTALAPDQNPLASMQNNNGCNNGTVF